MLSVLEEKTKGNLTPEETRLLESALFELRMAFLKITQALARSAASKAPAAQVVPAPQAPASSANDGGDSHISRHRHLHGSADSRLRLCRVHFI